MALFITKSVNDIVTEAYALLNAVDDEATLPASDLERGAKMLQLMLKSISAEGATIWLRRTEDVILVAGIEEYELDDDSIDAIELVQATVLEEDGTNELPVTMISREDYKYQVNKTATGRPVQVWFRRDETDEAIVTTWPVADATYTLRLDYRVKFTDQAEATDEIEIPDYWTEAVVYGLAKRIALPLGMAGTPRYAEVTVMAKDLHDTASAFDIVQDGGGETRFVPDLWHYRF